MFRPESTWNCFSRWIRLLRRRKLGFNGNEQLLLYVGRYVPVKGLDRLLKIMPHINNQNRDKHRFRLLVIGGDDENETIIYHVSKVLNIQKAVALIGRIDQELLPAYYSAADMLVVPSYHESFCLAGLESLACGTPVVATPVGGCRRSSIVPMGVFWPTDNDRAMAEAISACRK